MCMEICVLEVIKSALGSEESVEVQVVTMDSNVKNLFTSRLFDLVNIVIKHNNGVFL